MYINKIDDLIDRVIDDFYAEAILKNKNFDKLKGEINFVKSQKDINEGIVDYIKILPVEEIRDFVRNGDSVNSIKDTIQRYITIYVFLTLGIFYKGKPDVFINNIVEFSRNQSSYPLKIDNFFNSDSNSQIIKLYYICRNIITVLAKESIKLDHIRKEPYASDTMQLMGDLNEEFINATFGLKNLNNDHNIQAHNIIKTVIILLIYKMIDKKNLYNLIEQSELSEGDYMFIDIIEPLTDTISFNTIESLLSKEDIFSGLAHDIWDYMSELEMDSKKLISNDEKINILINSGIIIPIIDDFLLFHRDNERYDRMKVATKKKEDTKIRYIIGKIETTTELYSQSTKKDYTLRSNIMKNFSAPLYNRKAILRNNNEELKIINKYVNQGKRNIGNNDYLNDLIYYRRYAYANFKDFDKYGFSNHFTKTVTSVRAVNFDTESEFKQTNLNNRIQLRVGSKDSVCNIVGFMIPSNIMSIQCIKIGDLVNIRDLSKKNKNGFYLFMSLLKSAIIKNQPHRASVYWLFDPSYDHVKIEKIDNKEYISQQDTIKAMVAELYNRVVKEIYYEIIDRINLQPSITLDNAKKIINLLEKKILKIRLSKDIYEDIEKYVFDRKLVNLEARNNLKMETLYGLEGDIIQLPEYDLEEKKTISRHVVDLSHVAETGELIEEEQVEGICQHNITWDNISELRKKNYSEYMKQLYIFIQKYVAENTHQDYVCKSCGFYLDIKKYIQDGVFDDEKGFITFSIPMETNLEDIPEYEKYQFSIKIMDKNIEKIASSVGIPYFIGNTTTVKWRRKAIIKNTIDMVIQNNQLLSETYKERNETKTKSYGISKSLSNLFRFEMENNIFQTSSKDKDQEQFKMYKRNNIMMYIMIYIILEINESQISFFTTDKKNLSDIQIFDKVYASLFGGIRIKKNNSNDTVDITKYKILCYMIYMISCRIAKHKLWYSPQVTEKNIQKLIPIVQRYIVHTCVDIINSILENSFRIGVSYIFEIFRVRFYTKLNNIFGDSEYYGSLLEQSKFNYLTARRRKYLNLADMNNLPPYTYNYSKWRIHSPAKAYPPYLEKKDMKLNGISNLTNCNDGHFHSWTLMNGSLWCKLCNVKMGDLEYNEAETRKIMEKFKFVRINLSAQRFCHVDGELHQYVYDTESKQDICIKCKNPRDHKYTADELTKIEKIMDKINKERRQRDDNLIKEHHKFDENERQYVEKVVQKNIERMKGESDKENYFKFIDNFIDKIQGIVGDEIRGEHPINIRNNVYIIDHDHNGNNLEGNEIVITDTDNKILYKSEHPHFKTDVLYYTDKSGTRIDVFYDATTRKLLGYKEANKDYVDIHKTDKEIKINYSIYNKLKILGYSGEYINVSDQYKYIKENFASISDDEAANDIIYREIIRNISVSRIENLKKTIMEFQRLFNRILNDHIDVPEKEKEDVHILSNGKEHTNYFSEKMNSLIPKYKKRLVGVKIKDKTGKHCIFKHWKGILRGIFADNFDDKYFDFSGDLLEAEYISKYDDKSNMILYYFIHEISLLLDYNQDVFMKTNTCNFLVEFIGRVFLRYNTEYMYVDNDIKRFVYILSSTRFTKEIEEQTQFDKPQGFYEEYVDIDEEETEEDKEKRIDEEGEREGYDMDVEPGDMEEGVESRYDQLIEWEESY